MTNKLQDLVDEIENSKLGNRSEKQLRAEEARYQKTILPKLEFFKLHYIQNKVSPHKMMQLLVDEFNLTKPGVLCHRFAEECKVNFDLDPSIKAERISEALTGIKRARAYKVKTDAGIFRCAKDAAAHYHTSVGTMRSRLLNSANKSFSYLEPGSTTRITKNPIPVLKKSTVPKKQIYEEFVKSLPSMTRKELIPLFRMEFDFPNDQQAAASLYRTVKNINYQFLPTVKLQDMQ